MRGVTGFLSFAIALTVSFSTFAQVSDTINVTLTIQAKPKEVALSGLDDISIGYDGASLSGLQSDDFCLFAENNFKMKFASRNGRGNRFFLSGPGRPIVYNISVRSQGGKTSLNFGTAFEHNVPVFIRPDDAFKDRECQSGGNARFEIGFPEDRENGLATVTGEDLSDGKPHAYRDLLTVTLEPEL